MASTIPSTNAAFADWVATVKDVAFANQAALFLTAGQFAEIDAAANSFIAAFTASETSKLVTKGLVDARILAREETEELLRSYIQLFRANPDISPALKGQLGINVIPTPFGPVANPSNLTATGYANGQTTLRWSRNGNPSGTTIYVIEAKIGTSSAWEQVDVTTKTRLTTNGNVVGEQVIYRVFATRGGATSGPSDYTIVYPLSDAETLTLSEAA